MDNEIEDLFNLPLNIELLFENMVLDTISLLCVISCFEKKRKGVQLEQLAFYFSIATSRTKIDVDDKKIIVNNDKAKIDVDTWYLQVCSRINDMVGYLVANGLVDLMIEPKFNNMEIRAKINKTGASTVKGLNAPYYHDLIERVYYLIKVVDYNKRNLQKITGVNI